MSNNFSRHGQQSRTRMAANKTNLSATHVVLLLDVTNGDKQCGDRIHKYCFVITTNSSPHKIVYSKDDFIRKQKLLPPK